MFINRKNEFSIGIITLFVFILFSQSAAFAEKLVPVGKAVGVTLCVNGITVTSCEKFENENGDMCSPADDAGIKTGDVITELDGKKILLANELEGIAENAAGNAVHGKLVRDGHEKEFDISPQKASADGKWRFGVWVKDAASGIGTLTYYNPETMEFAALGHGITDSSSGSLVPIVEGNILGAEIVSIKKGATGHPGELVGLFADGREKLGDVFSNSTFGIKGKLENIELLECENMEFETAGLNEVHEGVAYIITGVDRENVSRYDIEIQKVSHGGDESRAMVIKITDSALIEKTGGIVQGMSGSPIIQDDKLIGAVTHVFVNDPTRGYAVSIESMLK